MNKIHRLFKWGLWSAAVLCLSGMQVSCNSDDIDADAMYTFTGETVASFCQNDPELSDFYQLITKCGSDALLEVYGHYTCFIPDNDAIAVYLSENNKSLDDITEEEAQKIVYDCVIRGTVEYTSQDFVAGSLSSMTLSERHLILSFTTSADNKREIWVNGQARVERLDQKVHNGVIHVVDKVIQPSELTLLEVMQNNENLSIWAMAFEASGLNEGGEKLYDESYVNTYGSDMYQYGDYKLHVPTSRRYGWTVFCEPDELLRKAGVTGNAREEILESLEDYAIRYYGSEELGDYKNEKNPLHRFVAYHLLNRQMATNDMVFDTPAALINPTYADKLVEYYETMYTYRIMEIKAGNKINQQSNGDYVAIDEASSNVEALNGYIHTLKGILVYDEEVMRNDVLHKRIRFDAMSLPPQLTNNNIRWHNVDIADANGYTVTPDYCGEYFTFNDACSCLMWGSQGWAAFQGDEINMKDNYDFTLRLLPVPPGNWEFRIGYNAEGWRGMGQIYVDGVITGTPVDLKIGEVQGDVRTGWMADEDTADDGVENDKMMRNLGYMKAPESCWYAHDNTPLRDWHKALRYIVNQYSFQDYGEHKLRMRTVDFAGREFSIDYFEFIPVDMIRDEDRL